MRYHEITSMQNSQVKAMRALRERRQRDACGLFIVEGLKMVKEATHCARVRSVFFKNTEFEKHEMVLTQLEAQGAQIYALSEAALKGISDAKTPQGIIACVEYPPLRPMDGRLIVALDGVQDPGNVGTIIRTADAAGFEGVLLGPGCADVYGAKTLRATMGSVFRMAIRTVDDLALSLISLRDKGYEILSSELSGTPFYARRASERAVLVIGNESAGVSPGVSREATQRLRLPMRGGAESLNAAVAAGIMMYELGRELDEVEKTV